MFINDFLSIIILNTMPGGRSLRLLHEFQAESKTLSLSLSLSLSCIILKKKTKPYFYFCTYLLFIHSDLFIYIILP